MPPDVLAHEEDAHVNGLGKKTEKVGKMIVLVMLLLVILCAKNIYRAGRGPGEEGGGGGGHLM